MLRDWIWSTLITLGIWLEVAGWARLLGRRLQLPHPVLLALGFALSAQAYFVFSLLGWGAPALHFALLVAGVAALYFHPRGKPEGPEKDAPPRHLHLRLARYFSPMSWRRAWPWLVLPVGWVGLRWADALVPHNDTQALAMTLLAPHRWLENGGQRLDPLSPMLAAASVWEGLTYHVQALAHGLAITHRTPLVRAHLATQMLHFTAGQLLAIFMLADLVSPVLRTGWDALVHATPASEPDPARRRHQLGMPAFVAIPSSLFFAWLACGQPVIGPLGTLAANSWGVAMLTLAAFSVLVWDKAAARPGVAWFLWGTAAAASPAAWAAGPALAAAAFYFAKTSRRRLKLVLHSLAGMALGLAPWLVRNLSQAGVALYPWSDAAGPGWISELKKNAAAADSSSASLAGPLADLGLSLQLLCIAGAFGLLHCLWKRRTLLKDRAIPGLLVFAVVTLGASKLLGALALLPPQPGIDVATTAVVVALALVGVALSIELFIPWRTAPWRTIGTALPYAWMLAGLSIVQLPVHVLWQHLPLALSPADAYLSRYHPRFDAKLWASLHLPARSPIAWTSDRDFYYVEQPSVSISGSGSGSGSGSSSGPGRLAQALLKAPGPRDRARMLCELGFERLAWDERDHGPEVAGLAAWLRLSKGAVLHTDGDLTFFDLGCR